MTPTPLRTARSVTGTHSVLLVGVSRRERLLIAGFWLLYGLVTVANRIFGGRAGPDGVSDATILFIALVEAAAWAVITPFLFDLVARHTVHDAARDGSLDAADPARASASADVVRALQLLALGALVAAAMAAMGTGLRSAFFPPRRGGGGPPIWFAFTNNAVLYGAVIAAALARAYSLQSRWREQRAVRLEAELARATLATLRQQVDPHFLFNTLHLISSLVERDPKGVRRMIARLSELLRASLDTGGTPEIPLRQELALLGAYLEIMQMRFGDRLSVVQEVDPSVLDTPVPSFLLQPLVENAMRHGLEPLRGAAELRVQVTREPDGVRLLVQDNGVPAAPLGSREGIGLGNTRARLRQLYGDRASLQLARVGDRTEAQVHLPAAVRA